MSKLLEKIADVLKLGEVAERRDMLVSRNRRWSEQCELSYESAQERSKAQPMDFDFNSTEIVRAPRATTVLSKKTQHGMTVTVGTTLPRTADVRSAPISRFFSVNHTVQGLRGSTYEVRRAASRQMVSADYDLWKGPTRQVTFLLG